MADRAGGVRQRLDRWREKPAASTSRIPAVLLRGIGTLTNRCVAGSVIGLRSHDPVLQAISKITPVLTHVQSAY